MATSSGGGSQTLLDLHLISSATSSKSAQVTKSLKVGEVKVVPPSIITTSNPPLKGGEVKKGGGGGGSISKKGSSGKTPSKTPTKGKHSSISKPSTGGGHVTTNEHIQTTLLNKNVENSKIQKESGRSTTPSSSLSIPLMDQNELTRLLTNVPKTNVAKTKSPNKVSPNKQHRIPKKPKASTSSTTTTATTTSGPIKKPALCSLPSNRVRMLMKTTPNVLSISQEAITVTSKAAELFISKLIQDSLDMYKKETVPTKEITYTHLAQSVRHNPQKMKFLLDFVPMKVKARDFLEAQGTKVTTNDDKN